jgi:short-subunit dehydrogenase
MVRKIGNAQPWEAHRAAGHGGKGTTVGKQKLRGQVAIVTGASSGVGWQTAVRLAEQGVRLCITARRHQALELLQQQLEATGAECLVVAGDVTEQEDVDNVVRQCVEHYGRVDILVNDAAVQSYGLFEDLPWEHIARTFDVTCFGYMRFARAVLPHFRSQGSGHIINVLDIRSKSAAPLLAPYAAAKHALLGWQKSLALELRGSGIEVSGVLVPSVSTPMVDHAPTQLVRAPRPVPPIYDPDVAARSVVRCAHRPGRTRVPVFLQGWLLLFADTVVPFVGNAIMARWGVPMQQRSEFISRTDGNLFHSMPEGVGRYGSVPPTPLWKRAGVAAGVLAAGLGLLGGAVLGGRGLARVVR